MSIYMNRRSALPEDFGIGPRCNLDIQSGDRHCSGLGCCRRRGDLGCHRVWDTSCRSRRCQRIQVEKWRRRNGHHRRGGRVLLWRWAKWHHDIPARGIAEKNLIVIERRSKREGLEFIIPTRTWGNSPFVMKVYCMFCLDPSASFEPVAVGVLVNSGFGSDDGSGTTKLVSVLNEEYRQLLCLKDVKAEWPGFNLCLPLEPIRGVRTCVKESWKESSISNCSLELSMALICSRRLSDRDNCKRGIVNYSIVPRTHDLGPWSCLRGQTYWL